MGARQVGKTTLIHRVLAGKSAVFLDFDLDIDRRRFQVAASLDPQGAMLTFGNPAILVIDEAQRLPECTRAVKAWYDAGAQATFILSGSSSFQLADQTADSLAGRNRKLLLPPLTFRETLKSRDWAGAVEADAGRLAPQVQTLLMTCMAFGQYPEATVTADKRGYLLNLVSDTLWKDILHMGLVKTPDLIRRLLVLLAHQSGSEVSVNELATAAGMSRATVERHLDLLEQAFVIFRLPAFSSNPRKEISKSRKIFFWDTGIRNALLNDFSENPLRPDIGRLWENWVIAEFAKLNLLSGSVRNLHFWRSRAGAEVDLVIRMDDRLDAYEIKWNPNRRAKRAFSEWYGVPVTKIDRSRPFVDFDDA